MRMRVNLTITYVHTKILTAHDTYPIALQLFCRNSYAVYSSCFYWRTVTGCYRVSSGVCVYVECPVETQTGVKFFMSYKTTQCSATTFNQVVLAKRLWVHWQQNHKRSLIVKCNSVNLQQQLDLNLRQHTKVSSMKFNCG